MRKNKLEAMDIIAGKMIDVRAKYGPDTVFLAGSTKVCNEAEYL